MKVDLAGLMLNSANQVRNPDRRMKDYYATSLEEVAENIEKVKKGEVTLEEFGEFYSMASPKAEGGSDAV